ncbi:MAG: rod shape-determining protein MreC [Candidatus Vogelbacteria bacterium]|nr:rod shape-determining protein MreC [Candidatus Vogelbacteria bacterium]
MSYLRVNSFNFHRGEGSGWKKPVLFAVTVIVLYVWGSGAFSDAFSFVTYPFTRFFGRASENFTDSLRFRRSLILENDRLVRENTELKVENQVIGALKVENEQLRGFRAGNQNGGKMMYAKVIAKPSHLPYDEIVIDAGTDNNLSLRPGLLVFADRRVILGQIEQVGKRSSKVKLYSEGGVSLPIAVGEAGSPSVALGLGNGNFSLSLPRGISVRVGDTVDTTIIGSYLLGYVGKINKDPNDPFQKILFRSPYNIFSLTWVFVSYD